MMIKYKYRFLGLVGLLMSIILIIFYSNIVSTLLSFIKYRISHDHHIEPEGIANIKKLMSTVIILLIGVSTLLAFNGFKKITELIETFIDVKKINKKFLTNDLISKENIQKRLFIVGTSLGFLLPFLLPIFNEPKSEGVIEEGSSMLFLIAALILLFAIIQSNKIEFTPSVRNKIKIILVAVSVLFIVMFGEEISWGQRIFGWESEGVFKDYNTQSETNIHNFFNPLFDILYPIFGLSLFLSLFFIWFFPKKNRTYLSNLFFPHPSTFFLVFMMACLSYGGHSEIFEELLALFCLLYSIRVFFSLKYPKPF